MTPAWFDVKTYGAVGDGQQSDTAAFTQALTACRTHGGGTVYVPPGTYRLGTVEIFDHTTLYLEAGAVLVGSPDLADYRPLPRRSEDRNTTLLLAWGARNVSITGRGAIDGNGRAFALPDEADPLRDFAARCTRQGEAYYAVNDVPEHGPIRHKPRPGVLILFIECQNVHVSGISVLDAPNWCLHVAACEDVLLTGLEFKSSLLLPNSDGIDVSLSRNVRISDCNIEAGDDGIAFSPCADGFGTGLAENITVTNCVISSRSAGIRIGWGEHSFRNLFFSNIIIRNSNRGIGLFVRGEETIENVVFSNIFIETRFYKGKWWGKAEPIHLSVEPFLFPDHPPGKIRSVTFAHVIIEAEHGCVLWTDATGAIEDIAFRDVRLHLRTGPLQETFGGNFDLRPALAEEHRVFAHDIPAFFARGVHGLQLENVTVTAESGLPAFFRHTLELENCPNTEIECLRAPAPLGPWLRTSHCPNLQCTQTPPTPSA